MDRDLQRHYLSQSTTGGHVISFAHGLNTDSALALPTRLRIGIYLAACDLSGYPLPLLLEQGRIAGLNGAEMAANQQGSSHDAKACICLALVTALVQQTAVPDATLYAALVQAGYSREEVLEVVAQAGLHGMLARLCTAIAATD